jgi:serine protease
VIEAAGNGIDLDIFSDAHGRSATRANDTGAVMVGAGMNPLGPLRCGFEPRQRPPFSNHGARIDCFASGTGIVTTSSRGENAPTANYTTTFGGTSSASAIVAGAAVALHGMANAANVPLSPARARALLSDTGSNTPAALPGRDRIGVMPNLRAIGLRLGIA